MLTLKNIRKEYVTGELKVQALRGVDIRFRQNEFVAVLGPSGCGKTTLLNIIGGLDRYTEGDLEIKGRSTREYTEKDWDSYRNHSIGFVFQSYNLIPHQTVLANVELALTLSGVGAAEREARARKALERVGLGDQLKKKPGEMSGGQMQRVAIARALVNDPEIILADEPTGALDSETSLQIMEALKEIAQDRLVIMVTHNPELAERYATRIVRLLDGRITADSDPCGEEEEEKNPPATGRTGMGFGTALHLSLNNLMTKKGRTFLVALAGSIGIIGIALILSLSNGVNQYIERVQRDTLSSYPLEIDEQTMDMTSTMAGLMDLDTEHVEHEEGKAYSGSRMTELMSAWMTGVQQNNLQAFKAWLEAKETGIDGYVSGIQYEYSTPLTLYRIDGEHPVQVNPSTVLEATGMADMLSMGASMGGIQQTMMDTSMRRMNVFNALLDNQELLKAQYEVLAGRMPEAMDEVVVILNSRNELSDYALYTLGLKDQSVLQDQFRDLMQGKGIESESLEFSFEELMNLRFRLMINTDYYEKDGSIWKDRRKDEEFMKQKLSEAMEIKVVGVVRPSSGAVTTTVSGGVGYRQELMNYLLEKVNESEIVREQMANPNMDVLTGQIFSNVAQDALALLDSMEVSDFLTLLEEQGLIPKGMIPEYYRSMLTKDLLKQFVKQGSMMISGNSLEENLTTLGVSDVNRPSAILIYPKNFEAKQKITEMIDEYNRQAGDDAIQYTDVVGLMMESVTTIVNAISYVLIAFVAISLVVSSIMIGIITYISVLERTKEIGILRAIGASRKDVSRVFNAETLIIGFGAGVIGILVTLLLTLMANVILEHLTGIPNMAALPTTAGLILVAISMALTLIAGIIPSRMAAKKDPVVALRTE